MESRNRCRCPEDHPGLRYLKVFHSISDYHLKPPNEKDWVFVFLNIFATTYFLDQD